MICRVQFPNKHPATREIILYKLPSGQFKFPGQDIIGCDFGSTIGEFGREKGEAQVC